LRRILYLYRSVVGKKVIVAVTGVILLGFLVGHVAGNLKVFLPEPTPGVPDIDVYAHFLRTIGEPLIPEGALLWSTRIVLGLALILHVICILQLALINRRARPVGYVKLTYVESTVPARWMLVTGSLLLVFVVLHILHFTTGNLDPARFSPGAVYANLHRAFELWYYVGFYAVSMALVSLHLYHGAWSLFQSLGIDNPDRNRGLRLLALLLAIGLFIGFSLVPLAFFSGTLEPPPLTGAHSGVVQ
jgi:succinate dehydrogenase / fumarate reductase cytochrome b subunit